MSTAMNLDQIELIDKDEHIEQASRAMKAMSHPLRLKILCVLGDREISVQDIVDRGLPLGRRDGELHPQGQGVHAR